MTTPAREPCGCDSRDGHAGPWVDPDLSLSHGERNDLCGDPQPWGYCLCGHPDYLTCQHYGEMLSMPITSNHYPAATDGAGDDTEEGQ